MNIHDVIIIEGELECPIPGKIWQGHPEITNYVKKDVKPNQTNITLKSAIFDLESSKIHRANVMFDCPLKKPVAPGASSS